MYMFQNAQVPSHAAEFKARMNLPLRTLFLGDLC